MRLIDANKLIKDIQELWDYKTVDDITATTVLKQTITDIENQPTVKAISIEWIRNYVSHWVSEIYKNFVLNMIKTWEKENARD